MYNVEVKMRNDILISKKEHFVGAKPTYKLSSTSLITVVTRPEGECKDDGMLH